MCKPDVLSYVIDLHLLSGVSFDDGEAMLSTAYTCTYPNRKSCLPYNPPRPPIYFRFPSLLFTVSLQYKKWLTLLQLSLPAAAG